jgi:molybdopterin biosynthesis enzyme
VLQLPLRTGQAAGEFEYRGGREMFRPARVDQEGRIHLFDWHGSADLAGVVPANCLVRLPSEGVTLQQGDSVAYLPIPGA